MAPRRLVMGITPETQTAQAVADALWEHGIEAFLTSGMWDGRQQAMVGYHAENAKQAALLEGVFEHLGVEGEVVFDELPGDDRLVSVFAAVSREQAHLMANLVERSGIRAVVVGDQVQHLVLVPRGQEPLALHVVGQFHAARSRSREASPARLGIVPGHAESPAPGDPPPVAAPDWSHCPECHRPRDTSCPKCHETGSHFPLAELVPEEYANDRPVPPQWAAAPWPVLCPLCDWLFEPAFYRRCAWCGHEFADGKESPPLNGSDSPLLNWRMALTGALLLLVMLALLVYMVLLGRPRNARAESLPPASGRASAWSIAAAGPRRLPAGGC